MMRLSCGEFFCELLPSLLMYGFAIHRMAKAFLGIDCRFIHFFLVKLFKAVLKREGRWERGWRSRSCEEMSTWVVQLRCFWSCFEKSLSITKEEGESFSIFAVLLWLMVGPLCRVRMTLDQKEAGSLFIVVLSLCHVKPFFY